ncbi:MAG TPA: hypothetical protein PKW80_02250 [Bacteroidales bacterium]|nr:hypothetical protein [Bacteroidales bacterium]
MKKLFIALLGVFAMGQYVYSQANEGSVEFDKADRPAVIGEFAYTTDVVEETVIADLKEKGIKKYSSKKGFMIFEEALFTQISANKINFYVKVEEKKKEKEKTVLTFMVSYGLDNFISSAMDATIINNTKTYMNGLAPKFAATKLGKDIDAQQKVYDKAVKEYENLVSDGESLAKKKADIEQEISKNKTDQEAQKALMAKEKANLELLQGQKK